MVLSIFDYSNKIRDTFSNHGYNCVSLDICKGAPGSQVNICIDILKWDYKSYYPGHFKFMYIALPCQCYSIASGSFHFKNNVPKTQNSINAINILIRIYQITRYFNCNFIIENPTGGLINNQIFNQFFKLNVSRLTLSNFGYPTRKQTDLFYNFDMLLIVPVTYRVNGRYQTNNLDNMSYRQRVNYPQSFCNFVVKAVIPYIANS